MSGSFTFLPPRLVGRSAVLAWAVAASALVARAGTAQAPALDGHRSVTVRKDALGAAVPLAPRRNRVLADAGPPRGAVRGTRGPHGPGPGGRGPHKRGPHGPPPSPTR